MYTYFRGVSPLCKIAYHKPPKEATRNREANNGETQASHFRALAEVDGVAAGNAETDVIAKGEAKRARNSSMVESPKAEDKTTSSSSSSLFKDDADEKAACSKENRSKAARGGNISV
jgi:hypothetical protein